MNRDRIEFLEYEPVTLKEPNENAFEYKPAAGWAWLQRLCFRFLRWRKCFALDDKVEYRRHVIDTPDLIERIHRQNSSLIEHYHRQGERLLIGAETLAELMHQPRIHQYVDMTAEYGYGQSIFGMRITVVPHMVGMLVLPREAR
jgi:hypothetical protein